MKQKLFSIILIMIFTASFSSAAVLKSNAITERIPAGTKFNVKLLNPLSTQDSKNGDYFSATLLKDIKTTKSTLLPAGSMLRGSVKKVVSSKRFSKGGILYLDFDHIVTPNGRQLPLDLIVSGKVNLTLDGGIYLNKGYGEALQNNWDKTVEITQDATEFGMDLGEDVLKEEDLERIEREMKKISKSDKLIKRIELTKEEALDMFKDDPYKVDLINNMPEGEIISAYKQDDFIDLCRGPHMPSTKSMKYFKLLKFSGAYYKGDSKNKMLQRIYGVCFNTEEDLNKYLEYLEELKERDHRKLGKDLNIFMTHELVGSGLPLWLPNGAFIFHALEEYIREKEVKLGYSHVYTPVLATSNLYKISGAMDCLAKVFCEIIPVKIISLWRFHRCAVHS